MLIIRLFRQHISSAYSRRITNECFTQVMILSALLWRNICTTWWIPNMFENLALIKGFEPLCFRSTIISLVIISDFFISFLKIVLCHTKKLPFRRVLKNTCLFVPFLCFVFGNWVCRKLSNTFAGYRTRRSTNRLAAEHTRLWVPFAPCSIV